MCVRTTTPEQAEKMQVTLLAYKDMAKKHIALGMRKAVSDSGLSIAEVARVSGIPQGSLRAYLNGKSCPDFATLMFFSKALGHDVMEIVGLG